MRLGHKRPFSKTLLRSATDERLEIGPKIVCRAVAKKFLISALGWCPHSRLGSFLFATGRMYLASIKSLVWPVWSRICQG